MKRSKWRVVCCLSEGQRWCFVFISWCCLEVFTQLEETEMLSRYKHHSLSRSQHFVFCMTSRSRDACHICSLSCWSDFVLCCLCLCACTCQYLHNMFSLNIFLDESWYSGFYRFALQYFPANVILVIQSSYLHTFDFLFAKSRYLPCSPDITSVIHH